MLYAVAVPFLLAFVQSPPPDDPPPAPPVAAQEPARERPRSEDLRRQEDPSRIPDVLEHLTGWEFEWFPGTALFRNYLADPLTPRSGSKIQFPLDRGDNYKIENALGSQRTLFRWTSPSGDEGIDLGLEGAVFSRFDVNEHWDLDAADYRVGFPFAWRRGPVSLKIHPWHLTSHLGDEYIERTESKRSDYHKEELAVGLSYDWTPEIRTYVDIGFGWYVTNGVNERWRAEIGAEFIGHYLWEGPPLSFIAVDIKWREETDWDTALCVQAGIWLVQDPTHATAGLRFLIEYYRGVTPQTQFPDESGEYISIGFAAGF